ncbi:MAG: hypothetical protein WC474_11110 [Hydrogenophilaceae bacterium]
MSLVYLLDLCAVSVCAITADIGGGTVRDVLLGRLRLPKNFFLIPDDLGMALFTVIGTRIAFNLEVPWLIGLDASGHGHSAAVWLAMLGAVAIRRHIHLPRLRDEG